MKLLHRWRKQAVELCERCGKAAGRRAETARTRDRAPMSGTRLS